LTAPTISLTADIHGRSEAGTSSRPIPSTLHSRTRIRKGDVVPVTRAEGGEQTHSHAVAGGALGAP
jgi:hypothetical protein